MTASVNIESPLSRLQAAIDANLATTGQLHVLEAGSGSATHIVLPPNAYVVGIDIAPEQLARNDQIDEKILGDIQAHVLPPDSFDLIICWDVLEHLPRPGDALVRFGEAVKPGGLILLAAPNLMSLKGWVTKFSPHWFHVWYYRAVHRSKTAGQPGYAPFPTFLRPSMSPAALDRFAAKNGLAVVYRDLYASTVIATLKRRSQILYGIYAALLIGLRILSCGQFDASRTDYFYLLQRPASDV